MSCEYYMFTYSLKMEDLIFKVELGGILIAQEHVFFHFFTFSENIENCFKKLPGVMVVIA